MPEDPILPYLKCLQRLGVEAHAKKVDTANKCDWKIESEIPNVESKFRLEVLFQSPTSPTAPAHFCGMSVVFPQADTSDIGQDKLGLTLEKSWSLPVYDFQEMNDLDRFVFLLGVAWSWCNHPDTVPKN